LFELEVSRPRVETKQKVPGGGAGPQATPKTRPKVFEKKVDSTRGLISGHTNNEGGERPPVFGLASIMKEKKTSEDWRKKDLGAVTRPPYLLGLVVGERPSTWDKKNQSMYDIGTLSHEDPRKRGGRTRREHFPIPHGEANRFNPLDTFKRLVPSSETRQSSLSRDKTKGENREDFEEHTWKGWTKTARVEPTV